MRFLTIGLSTAFLISLCSFVAIQVTSTPKELPVDQELYKKFLSKFTKAKLPYTLKFDAPKVRGKWYKNGFKASQENAKVENHLTHEFSKFIPAIRRGYMSRMGPDDYQAEVMVASNDKFNAIIYSKKPNYAGRKTTYTLMTFDQHGDLISKQDIARVYGESYYDAKISKNLVVSVKHYKAEYDDTKKYDDQQEMDFRAGESIKYTITATGEILKEGESPIKIEQQIQQEASPEIGMNEEEATLWEY
ncbi:MAG: hypothetical protein GY810_20385 [Aureispira sp.]|nr:hypothetical protein [Aureispira sp.]